MPLYSLDIEKEHQGEYWTNRYILAGPVMPDAFTGTANDILAAERAVTYGNVTFTKLRVSDTNPTTDTYIIRPLGLTGLRAFANVLLLPLFCVVRVDFPASAGRPSRKYLRGVLSENDILGQDVEPAIVNFVNTQYGDVLGALADYVDVDGQNLAEGRASAKVGMRQLRRGSRRRAAPVI
jgi:hypothetical protein